MIYRVSGVKSSLETSLFWANPCHGLSYYRYVWFVKRWKTWQFQIL